MKNRSVTLSLLTATLFAIPALAADAPAAPPAPPAPAAPGPWRAEMMQRFDQDKDGKLNDAERAAAREARVQMSAGLKKKFDRNQDGQLDESERRVAREAMRAKPGRRGGPAGFHGPRGRPPEWMRRELHRWFEQKWGGHPGARPGHHAGAGRPGKRLHAAMLKRFDADRSGRLDDTERAAMKQAGEERRARMQEHRKEVLARFDANGDHKLDGAEHTNLRDAWKKFIQQQPVVKPAGP